MSALDYEIRNLKRIVGHEVDIDTAHIAFSDGLCLDVTYDRLESRLMIHRWYLLYKLYQFDEAAHEALRAELGKFFADRIVVG